MGCPVIGKEMLEQMLVPADHLFFRPEQRHIAG